MTHTKGEWKIKSFNNINLNVRHIIYSDNGDTICRISRDDNDDSKVELANAKLISAAPDLLEALQEVVRISDRNHIAWDNAKAAIKKATNSPNS